MPYSIINLAHAELANLLDENFSQDTIEVTSGQDTVDLGSYSIDLEINLGNNAFSTNFCRVLVVNRVL